MQISKEDSFLVQLRFLIVCMVVTIFIGVTIAAIACKYQNLFLFGFGAVISITCIIGLIMRIVSAEILD